MRERQETTPVPFSSIKWSCPCTIYLSGCNTGNLKDPNSWVQAIADGTGCTVIGAGGFMTGTFFMGNASTSAYHSEDHPNWPDFLNSWTGVKPDYLDTPEHHASESDTWRTFTPMKKRECGGCDCDGGRPAIDDPVGGGADPGSKKKKK